MVIMTDFASVKTSDTIDFVCTKPHVYKDLIQVTMLVFSFVRLSMSGLVQYLYIVVLCVHACVRLGAGAETVCHHHH